MKKNKPNETLAVSQPGPREPEQASEPEYVVRFRGAVMIPTARASQPKNELTLRASQIHWPAQYGDPVQGYAQRGPLASFVPAGWVGLEIEGKLAVFPAERIESVWPL